MPSAVSCSNDINDLIQQLREVDLKRIGLEALRQQLGKIMDGFLCSPVRLGGGPIYRARITNEGELLHNMSQVWYKPHSHVATYGRLNDIGQSIFYAADTLPLAVLEVRPTIGSWITIIECMLKDPDNQPLVMELGLTERSAGGSHPLKVPCFEKSPEGRACLGSEDSLQRNAAIRSFLLEQFVRIVEPGSEYEYKISVALTSILMASEEIHGLIYPSIATSTEGNLSPGTNIALKPKAVDDFYRPVFCRMVQVVSQRGPHQFQADERMSTDLIGTDGGFGWI